MAPKTPERSGLPSSVMKDDLRAVEGRSAVLDARLVAGYAAVPPPNYARHFADAVGAGASKGETSAQTIG